MAPWEATRMLLSKLFDRFVEQAPVCVAARATLEAALNPAALDGLFDRMADRPGPTPTGAPP